MFKEISEKLQAIIEDDEEAQKHRVTNRKKSDAAKLGWKRHHYNYMKGNRMKSRNSDSFLQIAKNLEDNMQMIEAKVDKDNIFDYQCDIIFDNIAGGISFSIDKQSGNLSLSTFITEDSAGNFKQENGGNSQEELRVLYDNIKEEIEEIANTVDESLKQVFAKYGLRKT